MENKFLGIINLCPLPLNLYHPTQTIKKKICLVQRFFQETTAGSALIETLLQDNLASEKKPETIKCMPYDSCHEVQSPSKLIYKSG